MEYAHYNNENRLEGLWTVTLTGKKDDSPIIASPYTFAYFEAASCQFACPVPLPWTEWTCHCKSANNQAGDNPDNIPKCCGSTRKRFRGCKDQKCHDTATCKEVTTRHKTTLY